MLQFNMDTVEMLNVGEETEVGGMLTNVSGDTPRPTTSRLYDRQSGGRDIDANVNGGAILGNESNRSLDFSHRDFGGHCIHLFSLFFLLQPRSVDLAKFVQSCCIESHYLVFIPGRGICIQFLETGLDIFGFEETLK